MCNLKKIFLFAFLFFISEKSFSQTPTDTAILQKGKNFYYDKNYPEAIKTFSAGLKKNKSDGTLYYWRALSKFSMGRYKDALKDDNLSILNQPGLADAYTNRGQCYVALKKDSLAEIDFGIAIGLKNGSHLAYYNRGIARYNQKKYKEAQDDFSEVLALKNNFFMAMIYNGLINYYQKKYKESIANYDVALKWNAGYTIGYYDRAISKLELGDKEGACKDFEMAMKLGLLQAQKDYELKCK